MDLFEKHYTNIWKALIRPPREIYKRSDLGPSDFTLGQQPCKRHDISMSNCRKLTIECSFYILKHRQHAVPTVIYLHGNSSSRLTAIPYVHQLLPHFNVMTIDTSGSGRSDGDYVSLGFHEKEDVRIAIKYLREEQHVQDIFIWGRSMGAVTGLLFASKYGGLKGLILDSPFCDLEVLVKETALGYVTLPDFVIGMLIDNVRDHIKKLMNSSYGYEFDILKLKPAKDIIKVDIPIYFIAGKDDKLVNHEHTVVLYNKCRSRVKKLELIEGGHNGIRSRQLVDKIVHFIEDNCTLCHSENVDSQNEFECLLESSHKIIQENQKFLKHPEGTKRITKLGSKGIAPS